MNKQLQTILFKAKLNFIVLGGILLIAILGKYIAPELTNRIFETADQLISELVLIFVAITLGAFVPKFQWVVLGSIASFIGVVILIQIGAFSYLTPEYLFSILIVVLGFASIANLYKHYREFSL